MILLSKKRINLILICILVGILTFSFQTSKNDELKDTTSVPISGKTIIIDAGHGTPDEGAESSSRDNRGTN